MAQRSSDLCTDSFIPKAPESFSTLGCFLRLGFFSALSGQYFFLTMMKPVKPIIRASKAMPVTGPLHEVQLSPSPAVSVIDPSGFSVSVGPSVSVGLFVP